MTAGLSENDFWLMTPAQLARHFEGVAERARNELQRDMAIAWQGAAFQRSKRLPRLDSVLDRIGARRRRDTRPQTMQEMVAVARAWNKRLGGTTNKERP